MQINNIILKTITKLLLPFIILFALYIQFNGEYSPGGGFQAGIILASTFILYTMVFGNKAQFKLITLTTLKIHLALGVLIYILVGSISLFYDKNFLNYSILANNNLTAQQIGITLVELGIGITVCAAILLIFIALIEKQG